MSRFLSGYIETHQAYQNNLDLLELRLQVYRSIGRRPLRRYVVDKLLHNYADVGPQVMGRDDVKLLFVVREPVRTIQSTIAMAARKEDTQGDWKVDPVRVGGYYVRRLARAAIAGTDAIWAACREARIVRV